MAAKLAGALSIATIYASAELPDHFSLLQTGIGRLTPGRVAEERNASVTTVLSRVWSTQGGAEELCQSIASLFSPPCSRDGDCSWPATWPTATPELRIDFCVHKGLLKFPAPPPPRLVAWTGEKIVTVIRHAEGWHNIMAPAIVGNCIFDPADPSSCMPWHMRRDATLTPRGEEQSQKLRGRKDLAGAELVMLSPLARTLQTGILGLDLPEARWELNPDVQETDAEPCSVGDEVVGKTLLAEYRRRDLLSQYNALGDAWLKKTAGYFAERNVAERAAKFKLDLAKRSESNIVVVSHGAFLTLLLDELCCANAEVRTFSFRENHFVRL